MLNVLRVDLAGFVIWCGSLEFVGRTSKWNKVIKWISSPLMKRFVI
ncbi:hypothetical protein Hanom_Chr11g01024981 [Helianthus anomalus]